MAHRYLFCRPPNLLGLPLELLLKISEYLSFADLWYLATSTRHCKSLAHQLIWHKYHIDLSRPQLNAFNHITYAALAYVDRHGYNNNTIDNTIIQSVSNRLAVEIYDRSPLKNWEPCLDFFLDKTLGIILDHVLFDPLLDIVPKHSTFTDSSISYSRIPSSTQPENGPKSTHYRQLLMTEFNPTKRGKLMTAFLTTLYPTLIALFEVEPATEIHHRLLLNHINRHLDNMAVRYHSHHKRRRFLVTKSTQKITLASVQQYHQFLRLNFRILIRFVGTLIQTDLLSVSDLDIITRQHIQFFFLSTSQVIGDKDEEDSMKQPLRKKAKHIRQQQHKIVSNSKIVFFEALTNNNQAQRYWQMWLEEIEFQMEIFLDLTRAILLLQRDNNDRISSKSELNTVSKMLDNTVSALISSANSDSTLVSESLLSASTMTTSATIV